MPSSLFPGYKLVSSFSADDGEYETDEEVSYLTLDLGTTEPMLVPSTSEYRLIGLDSPTPFLQLSGTVFKGEHTSLLGSEMLFAPSFSIPPQDSHTNDDMNLPASTSAITSHQNRLQFLATTSKRIRFKEVQLKPKARTTEVSADSPQPPVETTEGSGVGIIEAIGSKDKKKGKAKDTGNGVGTKPKKSRKGKGKADTDTLDVVMEDPEPSGLLAGTDRDVMEEDDGG